MTPKRHKRDFRPHRRAADAARYPEQTDGVGRRRALGLIGASIASALSLGARGGCMPVRPAPLDIQRGPDAGPRPDSLPADALMGPDATPRPG